MSEPRHGEGENLKGLWWRRRLILGAGIHHAPLPDTTAAGPTSIWGFSGQTTVDPERQPITSGLLQRT